MLQENATGGKASVTDGRDGSPSRPRVILAGTVASARRPYQKPICAELRGCAAARLRD